MELSFPKSSGKTTLLRQKVQKAAVLRTAMGRDCLKVLKSINLFSAESQDSKACLQALENYFKPAKN